MRSVNLLDFLSPSPCPHRELTNTTRFTQPPSLHLLFQSPSGADVIYGWSPGNGECNFKLGNPRLSAEEEEAGGEEMRALYRWSVGRSEMR